MSLPHNRTPEERAAKARNEVFINIKAVWAEIYNQHPEFEPTRLDQATRVDTRNLRPAERIKIEVRYGSRTVRVLLLKGDTPLKMWDLQTDGTRDKLDLFLVDLKQAVEAVAP